MDSLEESEALVFNAIATEELSDVKDAITNYRDLYSLFQKDDEDGRNLLHYGCMYNQDDVATYILSLKDDYVTRNRSSAPIPRDPDDHGATAVMYAARAGMYGFVSDWISNGSDIDTIDNEGRCVLNYILGEGPDIPAIKNARQKTYSQQNTDDIIQLIQRATKLPQGANKFDTTPLMYASRNGIVGFVRKWIELKYEINSVDKMKRNVLHYCFAEKKSDIAEQVNKYCHDSMEEIVQLLIDSGVDFLCKDKNRKCCLQYAIENRFVCIITYILSNVNRAKNVYKKLSLESMAAFHGLQIFPRIMLPMKPINVVGGYMHLCLRDRFTVNAKLAKQERISDLEKIVLTAKLKVDETDDNGMTALHHLCYYLFDSEPYGLRDGLVAKMLDLGADPNIEDKTGYTPLMWAISKGFAGGNEADPRQETVIGRLLKASDHKYMEKSDIKENEKEVNESSETEDKVERKD